MAGRSQTTDLVVLQIGELLRRDELQTTLETPTSIFKLPDSVTHDNPQAYSPSRLFLGPFHEFRPELHKMEIFKLENAKKAKEKFHLPEFTQTVDELKESELQIRACYGGNLAMGSEALAWRILIDGLFLLRLLGISPDDKEDHKVKNSSDRRFELQLPVFNEQQLYLNLEGNITMTQNEIVKDLLKLENQIPIQVLKRVLPRNMVEDLHLLLYKFCESVSPLVLTPYQNDDDVPESSRRRPFPTLSEILDESQHLLHFLYALLFYQRSLAYRGAFGQRSGALLLELLNMMAKVIRVGFLQQLVEAVGLIQSLIGLLGRVHRSSFATESSPRFPSASELKKVGVKFGGGDGGGFDKEKATLKLPVLAMNAFCEVILRNLVAFEAEARLKPPCFSHYVKLMSGLIATAKDVQILKRAGIIAAAAGDSGNDEDVVKLFKDLGKLLEDRSDQGESGESTSKFNRFYNFEVHIIEEINEYYESCWRVKAERFAKRHICPVFQALIILVVGVLILIVAVRTVCGWFSCPKILGHGTVSAAAEMMNIGHYFM